MIYVKKFSSASERLQDSHDLFMVHLLSATIKEGGISHQFNEKICSNRVASTINSTKRSAQLGLGSLTRCNGQRGIPMSNLCL